MKLSSRQQIKALAKFKAADLMTTSFYLDTGKGRLSQKAIIVSFKNVLSQGRAKIESLDASRNKKESLQKDLEKISRFGTKILPAYTSSGLALFSCAGANFWQDFSLPDAPRNRIIFDQDAYVRPMSAILDEYHQICALLLERREARWFDIFLGEISALDSISSAVPSRVREGGWEGYESKRIERHVDALLREHFKKASQKTFDLFKKNPFDWLMVGCKEEYRSEFEPLLHPYLRERLRGWLKTNSNDTEDKILKQTLKIERKLKKEEEAGIIQAFASELEQGGRAVSGVRDVLRSLNRSGVQTLIVTRNFSKEGRFCPKCHFLYLDEARCPFCQVKTEKAVDVIDEALEEAMDKKCEVRHITPPSRLDRYGKIGAFLRYKS
jgi:peptide subunit release factor 1 (eRF1)